ncbi:MAG: DUF1905 domain-containing protein [Nakamurella sp.]
MQASLSATFTAPLFRWEARVEEVFLVSLPQDLSDHIRDLTAGGPPRGFGSVKVSVLVGTSRWRTSIFPGKDDAPYVLPIKRAVYVREGIEPGDPVTVHLDVLDG